MLYFQHCACCRRGGLCHRSFRHSSQWRLFHPQPWLSEMLQAVSASSELERSTFNDLWLLVSLDQKDGYDLFWIVYILLCYVFYYLYYCINYLVPEDILEHLGFIASNDCYCICLLCIWLMCYTHFIWSFHNWPSMTCLSQNSTDTTVIGCSGFHGDCLTLTKIIDARLKVLYRLDFNLMLDIL